MSLTKLRNGMQVFKFKVVVWSISGPALNHGASTTIFFAATRVLAEVLITLSLCILLTV